MPQKNLTIHPALLPSFRTKLSLEKMELKKPVYTGPLVMKQEIEKLETVGILFVIKVDTSMQ